MCMIFYRRDTHIAEMQMGLPAARLEDACTVDNFDILKLPYVTLIGEFWDFTYKENDEDSSEMGILYVLFFFSIFLFNMQPQHWLIHKNVL